MSLACANSLSASAARSNRIAAVRSVLFQSVGFLLGLGYASGLPMFAQSGTGNRPADTSLALSGTGPYSLTCSVSGIPTSSGAVPTGTVKFKNITTAQTLGTGSLGGGSQTKQGFWPVGGPVTSGVVATVGDVNGDGKPDVVISGTNLVQVALGNGDGTFQSALTTNLSDSIGGLFLADFNHDGKMDLGGLKYSNRTGYLVVSYGNGDGTFQSTGTTYMQTLNTVSATPADINGDGYEDLLFSNQVLDASASWWTALNDKNGGVTNATTLASYTATDPNSYSLFDWSMIPLDVNGDGKADMVGLRDSGEVDIRIGNGDGTFQPAVSYPPPFSGVLYLVAGKFNNNGTVDLALFGHSTIAFLYGNGDGTFQQGYSYTITLPSSLSGSGVCSPKAGPFLAPGKADLAFPASGNPEILIYGGNGDGTFATPVSYAVPQSFDLSFNVCPSVDFNGDGLDDALGRDGTGATYVLLNGTVATVSATQVADTTTADGASQQLVCSYEGDSNFAPADSSPVTVSFTAAALPLFSLRVGTYSSDQNVSITDSTSGVQIFYTTDGSSPTTHSTLYTGPIALTSTMTLKAIAAGSHNLASAASEAVYNVPDPPQFSLPAGSYSTPQTVTISDSISTATIYYTTDGTTPGTSSTKYTGPLTISGSTSLQAIAQGPGQLLSQPTIISYNEVSQTQTTTKLTPSTLSTALTASGAAITLTASVTGSKPTGTISFSANGKTIATASLSNGIATAQTVFTNTGNYSVTAAYSGDSQNAASTATTNLVITPAASTTSLASTTQTVDLNQQFMLTATVKGYFPSGSVTFTSGTTTLGTATISGGLATLQTAFSAAGTFFVTATYPGDTNNAASASSALTITSVAPDYSLQANPPTQTISAGQSATFQITVTPSGGYSGTTNFACVNLPSEADCTFSPVGVTVSGGPASTTLTISTTGGKAALEPMRKPARTPWVPLGTAFTGVVGISIFGKRMKKGRRALNGLFSLSLLAAAGMFFFGCGSSSTPPTTQPGTPVGSYSVAVNASAGGSSLHTLQLQLTVK